MDSDSYEPNLGETTFIEPHVPETVEIAQLVDDAYLSMIGRERVAFSSLPVDDDILGAVVEGYSAAKNPEEHLKQLIFKVERTPTFRMGLGISNSGNLSSCLDASKDTDEQTSMLRTRFSHQSIFRSFEEYHFAVMSWSSLVCKWIPCLPVVPSGGMIAQVPNSFLLDHARVLCSIARKFDSRFSTLGFSLKCLMRTPQNVIFGPEAYSAAYTLFVEKGRLCKTRLLAREKAAEGVLASMHFQGATCYMNKNGLLELFRLLFLQKQIKSTINEAYSKTKKIVNTVKSRLVIGDFNTSIWILMTRWPGKCLYYFQRDFLFSFGDKWYIIPRALFDSFRERAAKRAAFLLGVGNLTRSLGIYRMYFELHANIANLLSCFAAPFMHELSNSLRGHEVLGSLQEGAEDEVLKNHIFYYKMLELGYSKAKKFCNLETVCVLRCVELAEPLIKLFKSFDEYHKQRLGLLFWAATKACQTTFQVQLSIVFKTLKNSNDICTNTSVLQREDAVGALSGDFIGVSSALRQRLDLEVDETALAKSIAERFIAGLVDIEQECRPTRGDCVSLLGHFRVEELEKTRRFAVPYSES